MFKSIVKMIAGDPAERALASCREVITRINALESSLKQ